MRQTVPMLRPLSLFGFLLAAAPALAAELPRGQILLASAISVDAESNTVRLPLFRGEAAGETVWYIVTDSSDEDDARRRGVVYAPLLGRAGHVQAAVQKVDRLEFQAAPDFSDIRKLSPGPEGFPPADASPGATAPAVYSPFIRIGGDGPVLNAPVVATGEGPFDLQSHSNTMDRVLAIDTKKGEVTLLLSHGFAEGRRIVYISTEASDPVAAALERATWVPRLGEGDADIGLLVFASGEQGQGMAQAMLQGGLPQTAMLDSAASLAAPLNILTAFPMGKTARGYSPSWRVTLLRWSPQATGQRITGQAELWKQVSAGRILGMSGGAPEASDMVVNCPVIAWLDGPVP